ncbi:hypothetical protein ACFLUS_03590 [Chloroflexota bacterium]
MWIKLSRLLTLLLLRQRGIDPRDVTVFVDDHVIHPRSQRPLREESTFEEEEDLYENDSEEY